MNTFLLIRAYMSFWMVILFGIIWFIANLTKPEPFDEENYWKENGFYKNELGLWTRKEDKNN